MSGSEWRLFEEYSCLVIEHPEIGIETLLSHFANAHKEEEIQFIKEYFPVFISCGYAAREAPEGVKKDILQERGKRN